MDAILCFLTGNFFFLLNKPNIFCMFDLNKLFGAVIKIDNEMEEVWFP